MTTEESAPRSKVGRVIRSYGLEGVDEELESRWLGQERERQSLRDLARYLNRRILEEAIVAADGSTVDGEVDNLYRLLTDEEVPAVARAEAESELERLDIDVEALREDFVSHQAIYTYLRENRGVSAPDPAADQGDPVGNRRDAIQRLRNRLLAVTNQGLEDLHDAGHISIGSCDVVVNVAVHCIDCGTTRDIAAILDDGGCDCGPAVEGR